MTASYVGDVTGTTSTLQSDFIPERTTNTMQTGRLTEFGSVYTPSQLETATQAIM
nr:hypothetical protein TetV2_00421 [Oceanusvirus sp.]